jgi:hypothetical protein
MVVLQVLVVGHDQGALLSIHPFPNAPAFGPLQARLSGGLPAGLLVGNFCQVGMFIQFDRAHIGQFQSVHQGKVVFGVIPLSELLALRVQDGAGIRLLNEGAASGEAGQFDSAIRALTDALRIAFARGSR